MKKVLILLLALGTTLYADEWIPFDTKTGKAKVSSPSNTGTIAKPYDFTNVAVTGISGGPATTTFLGLTDAPDSYAAQALKVVRVNVAENGLEFANVTGIGSVTSVGITPPAAGITVSGSPVTTAGNITLSLANDLAALEALTGTNTIYYRSAADTWSPVTIGANMTFAAGVLNSTGGGGGTPGGSNTQFQYNNAGAFGGVPTLTYDGSNMALTGNLNTTALQSFIFTNAGGADQPAFYTFSHRTTSSVLADFGGSLAFQAESTTTNDRPVAEIVWGWKTATDSSRAGYMDLDVYDITTKRRVMRLFPSGSAGLNTVTDPGTSGTFTADRYWVGGTTPSPIGNIMQSDASGFVQSAFTMPTSFTQGAVFYGSAANVMAGLTKSTTATRYLANTGTNNNPAWDQVNLTNGVTGALPSANAGVLTGGATDQLLAKNSNTNYDLKWVTPAAGGNVSNSGTPTINQLPIWLSATTIKGVTPVLGGTTGQVLKKTSNTDYDWAWAADSTGAGGTVTDFGAGDLSPLFTTTEATTTTTPALSFGLTNAAANTVFGRAAGTSGAPTYSSSPQFTAIGNLVTNGFVKTSGGVGTLSIDTTTYLTGNQSITLSSDVTGSGTTSITTTIAPNAVTLGKMADMATDSIIGRATAATGDPEVLTALPWAFTGDVTSVADANALTIANNAVTLGKMATMATDSILGRATATTGNVEVLTSLPFAFTGDVTRPADSNVNTIANDAVTYAKMQNVSAASKLLGRGSASGAGDTEEITVGSGLTMTGTTIAATVGGGGTVTDFSAGDLSPLFTTTEATTTTTPALSFVLRTDTAANTVYGRAAGSAGAATFSSSPQFTAIGNLTGNGFIKTSGGVGTLSVDTATYLTGNQAITLTGDVTGGPSATSITTTLASGNAGNLNSGTLLAARMPALTGDVTSTAGTVATTIANNSVTLGKMATMATDSILGRATAATGNVEVLTALPWALTGEVTTLADSNATTIADGVTVTGWVMGASTATTPGAGDNDTSLATTAFVQSEKALGANPSASIGLSAVNGVATTFLRSDGAPALSQSITPTWTGLHTFNANVYISNGATSSGQLRLFEDSDDGTNFAAFSVPALAANTVYTLPPDDGDAGEQLQTNGSGILTWEAAGSGGGSGTVTSITATSPVVVTPTPLVNTGVISLNLGIDLGFTTGQSITLNNAITNSASTLLSLIHNTTGTPANGIGSALVFSAETSTSPDVEQGEISSGWSDVTHGSRTSYMSFLLSNSGSITSKMRLFASGALSVGSTTDPGVSGIINANTGFRVANAATSRKMLVGDGTNFVPSTETWAVPGTNGNILTSDGTNWTSAAPAGGGGGTPGGSTTQVQYNNASAFGGITNATSDGTTMTLTSPKVVTDIKDTNGNTLLGITATASADDYVRITNHTDTPLISPDGADTNINLTMDSKGIGRVSSVARFDVSPEAMTFPSSGSTTPDYFNITPGTLTLTGSTTEPQITFSNFYQPTITDSSAITVTDASTVYIFSQPIAAGSVTITRPWAIWVDFGNVRFDAGLTVGGTASPGTGVINANTGFKISDAAASRKILVGNGTNYVASTETYAVPGTSGNVLTSDGTNWTSAAPAGGGGGGYTMEGGIFTAQALADATTYFYGYGEILAISAHTSIAPAQMTVPKTGTITRVHFNTVIGTNGTNESVQHYLRKNNTTDTTLSTTETYDPGANTAKAFIYTGLSIAVSAGDTIAFKIITPTWATNPTIANGHITVWIE